MPQYNMPALITQLIGGDIILVWQTSSGAVKTIVAQDLATSLEAMMNLNDSVTFITSNTLLSNQQMVVANSGAPFTISLPAAVSFQGKSYKIFNKGAGLLTVQRTGTDTIAGVTSLTIPQYSGILVEADGQNTWFRITSA